MNSPRRGSSDALTISLVTMQPIFSGWTINNCILQTCNLVQRLLGLGIEAETRDGRQSECEGHFTANSSHHEPGIDVK